MAIDRRWLVRNRSKIQHRMLRLDEFGKVLKCHEEQDVFWLIYTTLVGVVFSLWRAVFLIQVDRSVVAERLDTEKLLGILIDTNAIGFPQDVATAQWTAGYYVNNAMLRLYALGQYNLTKRILSDKTLEEIGFFRPDVMMSFNFGAIHLDFIWVSLLKEFDAVFRDLKSEAAKRGLLIR
jgi:hypothetical protein